MKTMHNSAKKFGLKLMILVILASLTIPTFVFAQGNPAGNPTTNPTPTYTPLEPLPCVPSRGSTSCDQTNKSYAPGALIKEIDFKTYIQNTFNLLIALAAAAAVFMTVWGGFQYMTTDSWENKKNGLEKARNALLGLLLILCSFLILRTIDPRLVAIPNTLVKPLDIKYTKSSSDFFETLKNDADRYQSLTDEQRKNVEQLDAQAAVVKQQRIDAEQKLKEQQASGDPAQTETAKKAADLANQENMIKANAEVAVEKTAIYNALSKLTEELKIKEAWFGLVTERLNRGEISTFTQSTLDFIDERRSVGSGILQTLGAYEQTGELNDYAVYAKIIARISGLTATVDVIAYTYGGASASRPTYISQIDAMVDEANATNDPARKQELLSKLQGARIYVNQKLK